MTRLDTVGADEEGTNVLLLRVDSREAEGANMG